MARRKLEIELLYLDLDVCQRCQGTDRNMEEAIAEVSQILEATGTEIEVKKTHVETEEQARQLGFISSPTIRINGRDIQLDVKETRCESCGDLCGEEVDCRIWTYQGKEYTVPPKAMIIEAILREVYGSPQEMQEPKEPAHDIPENLKRFFAAKQKKQAQADRAVYSATSCCLSKDFCSPGGCCG
ncbi:MAG: DUF2703 domain-containing protein [Clostridia bacterium]|nr:DUF2703 domain-containing protein [Clostridia bacterium]